MNDYVTLWLNLELIREMLEKLWCKEAAYPASLETGKQTKSRGQCYVTALLIKHLYGGEVMKGIVEVKLIWVNDDSVEELNGQETHYWNRINDEEIDFTSDQYGGDGFKPVVEGKPVKHLNWNNKRFKILLARLEKLEKDDIGEEDIDEMVDSTLRRKKKGVRTDKGTFHGKSRGKQRKKLP